MSLSYLVQKISRTSLFLMALMGIGGFFLGLILEHYGNFPACRLCHIERLFLLSGGMTCFFSWIWWSHKMGKTFSFLTSIQWVVGSLVSLYHTAIQYGLLAVPHFCNVQEASSLDEFMSRPSASCDQRTLDFLGIPACLYLTVIFMICALFCLLIVREKPRA